MSCDIAAAGMIWLASLGGGPAQGLPPRLIEAADIQLARAPLATEPLYADIVQRATHLKARVEGYQKAAEAPLSQFAEFQAEITDLSALDMKGHLDLAARGTDGDLKCILKGISQDLPRKLAELNAASTPKDRSAALEQMFYLLRDNAEVITAPPAPPV